MDVSAAAMAAAVSEVLSSSSIADLNSAQLNGGAAVRPAARRCREGARVGGGGGRGGRRASLEVVPLKEIKRRWF